MASFYEPGSIKLGKLVDEAFELNWTQNASNGNREADRCFNDLDDALQAKGNIALDIDDLIRGMSAVWASNCSSGSLLSDRDLLKEAKLKPLAQDLGNNWNSLSGSVVDMSARISNLGLRYRETYHSLNALFILWGLEAIVQSWLVNARLNVTDRDNFDKDYESLLTGAIDRWFFLSQWAGTWSRAGDTVFHGYLKDLSALRVRLGNLTSWNASVYEISTVINGWLARFYMPEFREAPALKCLDGIMSVCYREAPFIGVSPNGKATDSDSVTLGSNPGTPAKYLTRVYSIL